MKSDAAKRIGQYLKESLRGNPHAQVLTAARFRSWVIGYLVDLDGEIARKEARRRAAHWNLWMLDDVPDRAAVVAVHFDDAGMAVVNWGRDKDSGFPMQYDNGGNERRWRISKRQWYATTHSSVGDALLLSGLSARAKDATTPEILAGKFKTIEQVQEAYGRHMDELLDALKAKRGRQRARRPVRESLNTRHHTELLAGEFQSSHHGHVVESRQPDALRVEVAERAGGSRRV